MNKRIIPKGLRAVLQPPAITNCLIDKKAHICSGSQLKKVALSRYSYIGHDCFVLNTNIDAFCSIADNCRIGGATHPMDRVSTSPVFIAGKNVFGKNFAVLPDIDVKITSIGADVWIGANVVIISGVSIGVGAVVGAGSVVTHDIPPYEIWAGNPARKIRDRFDEKTKIDLLETKWWTWDDKKLRKYSCLFDNPKTFTEEMKMIGDIE